MGDIISMKAVVGSLLYSLMGVGIFALTFFILDKITPGDMWAELIEKKNLAVAILSGAVAIGIALIVSAAIHG